MAQVTGHEIDAKGNHYLTFDDGSTLTLKQADAPIREDGAPLGWGEVLAALGHGLTGVASKPKGKTRSG